MISELRVLLNGGNWPEEGHLDVLAGVLAVLANHVPVLGSRLVGALVPPVVEVLKTKRVSH